MTQLRAGQARHIVRRVPVQEILHQIQSLRRTDVLTAGGHSFVTQACVLNLIVYLEGQQVDAGVHALLEQLALQHPLRAVLIVRSPDTTDTPLEADLYVVSHPLEAEGRQVCCAEIVLRVPKHTSVPLSSILTPLLQHDLPTFLWWATPWHPESPTFRDLIPLINRLILYSAPLTHPAPDPVANLRDLAQFVQQYPGLVASHADWIHLVPWLQVIVSLFDERESLPWLSQLDEVSVDFVPSPQSDTLPSAPLLLVGWLAGHLGWKPQAITEDAGKGAVIQFDTPTRALRVRLQAKAGQAGETGGILAAIFKASSSGGQVRFQVVPAGNPGVFRVTKQVADGNTFVRDLVALPLKFEQVLCQELVSLEHNPVFERALLMAADILSAPGQRSANRPTEAQT